MLVLFFIFVLSLLVYMWNRRRFYILSWKLKGPLGLPFVGTIQLLNPKYILKYFISISKSYKAPTTFWLGPICFLYVNDPENMERILKAPECINKSIVYKSLTRLIGDGLLSNNNPKWANHRKLLNPCFNHKTLMSFFTIFNTEANILHTNLNKYVDTNEGVDIQNLMERFTLSIATQTTMGTNTNMQLDENNQVLKSAHCLIRGTSKQMLNIFYRFDWFGKIFDSKFFDEKYKAWDHVTYFVNMFVFGKLYNQKMQPNSVKAENSNCFTKSERTVVDHITNLYQKQLFSMDDVMSESYHILAAAYETTATALYYIITLLAIHPEWQEKLHDEIKQVFPHRDFDVLFEHMNDVPLVEMIINETFRLLPVVPLHARITDADFQLNDDILLPKGTNIVLDIHSLHRNPKYWGPDALEFNPYRFLPEAIKERHPYTFVPFSKGLRNCIGWRYAYFLLKVFVIKVSRNYRFTTTTKLEEIELHFDVVSRLKVNPVVKVQSRLE